MRERERLWPHIFGQGQIFNFLVGMFYVYQQEKAAETFGVWMIQNNLLVFVVRMSLFCGRVMINSLDNLRIFFCALFRPSPTKIYYLVCVYIYIK
jgi:hypothetical protein